MSIKKISGRLALAVIEALPPHDQPGIPPREVNLKLPFTARVTIRNALRELVKSGHVAREGQPPRYLYRQGPLT